jgi:hypothetical protein
VAAKADTRYSFAPQFLVGAAKFAKRAREIEDGATDLLPDDLSIEHRALVVSAVVQSALALEAESLEILKYGPRHHQGSSGINDSERQCLTSISTKEPTLERYQLILSALRGVKLPGDVTYQNAKTLIELRDALVHYKSLWGEQMDNETLFKRLKDLKLKKPTFVSSDTSFFPHHCLSASLGSWAVLSAKSFIDALFNELQITCPLADYKDRLAVPNPIKA